MKGKSKGKQDYDPYQEIIDMADHNDDGSLDLDEVIDFAEQMLGRELSDDERDDAWYYFEMIDSDQSGGITADELRDFFESM